MVDLSYNSWPFSRQLKLTQILFSIFLTTTLILITRYQLLWLEDKFLREYKSVLKSDLYTQMRELSMIEKNYIELEFSNYIQFVENLHKFDSLILGFSNSAPIYPSTPVQHTAYGPNDFDYSTGSFMSSYSLSSAGIELEAKHAGMDKIYPLVAQPKFLFIYSGFEIDEIIHYYPGSFMSVPNYSPITREWYYKAKDSIGEVIITEPYFDATTGASVLTISKALLDNNEIFFGVVACDITLFEIQSKLYSTKILEKGFLMFVSIGGMVLNVPEIWNVTQTSAIIIYDTGSTGISKKLWENIVSSEDGKIFEFTRAGSEYLLIKYRINTNKGKTSHYIIACGNINEIVKPATDIEKSLNDTNYLIFFLVVSIEIVLFSAVGFALHFMTISLSSKLKFVKNVFVHISNRALMPNVCREIEFRQMQLNSKGIESLADAVKIKVLKTMEREESFKYFYWDATRPNERFLYSGWSHKLYALNYWCMKIMPWRMNLNKIQAENFSLIENNKDN